MTKIVELKAENTKRLSAVTVRPDGSLVVIAGKNGAGKSSTLDAIEMALRGGRALPEEPIRRGARKGAIRVELDNGLIVERKFSKSGSKLEVTENGAKLKSPQAILDALTGTLTFDPLEFAVMPPKEQDATLRALVGLDVSDLDAKRAELYESRKAYNRDAKRLEAQIDGMPEHAGVGTAEKDPELVSVSELLEELKRVEEHNEEGDVLRASAEQAAADAGRAQIEVNECEAQVLSLQAQLDQARANVEIARGHLEVATNNAQARKEQADSFECQDEDAIRERLSTVEETNEAARQEADDHNRKVRENRERKRVAAELEQAETKASELTAQIEQCDEEKAERLAAADFPIPGLGLDDCGVTLDGLPFEQACTSAKIRASIAIGAALNPDLRVLLVRRGNDLDGDRLREVAAMAEELGCQLWVERIESGGLPAVVIEDGHVAEQSDGKAAE